MGSKNAVFLLLLAIAFSNACDFDFLVETLYDDYESDEDESTTTQASSQATTPSSANSTPNSSSSSASTSASQSTSAVTQASSPQTNSAPRQPKERRHRKKSKHIIGRILKENFGRDSKLFDNINPMYVRYATDTKHGIGEQSEDPTKVEKESGRNFNHQNTEDLERENNDSPRFLTALTEFTDDDDDSIIQTSRSTKSNQDMLLKLLMGIIHENEEMQKRKHEHALKQKKKRRQSNKKALEFFVKLLENNWKHVHEEPKKDSGISQQVVILLPEEKTSHNSKKENEDEGDIVCKTDKGNAVTCIRDKTVYETIKLNPKDNSGMRKVDESVRYSTMQDQSKMKESMDQIFHTDRNYYDHEPYPYHHSKNRDDHYMNHDDRFKGRPHFDTSNRFNPEESDKPVENSTVKNEDVNATNSPTPTSTPDKP